MSFIISRKQFLKCQDSEFKKIQECQGLANVKYQEQQTRGYHLYQKKWNKNISVKHPLRINNHVLSCMAVL